MNSYGIGNRAVVKKALFEEVKEATDNTSENVKVDLDDKIKRVGVPNNRILSIFGGINLNDRT